MGTNGRHMFDTERLRREERKALEVLVSNWNARHTRTEILCLEQIITGKTFFTINTFKTSMLPKGQGWVWNQSRSRNTIQRFGHQIDFYKVNARKAKYSPYSVAPSYKVWIFHIKSDSEGFSFLWCERGQTISPQPTQISIIHSPMIT